MDFFSTISLRSKLIGIILLVTVFALCLGMSIYILTTINQYKEDLRESMLINTRLIAEHCVGPMEFEDQKGATELLNGLSQIPAVVEACIFDVRGVVFAKYRLPSDSTNWPSAKFTDHSIIDDDFVHVYQSIQYNGINYGIVYTKTSFDGLYAKIWSHVKLLCLLSVGILIISFLLAAQVQKWVSKPLLKLADVSRDITERGDYSIRVERNSEDEIGILYSQFNMMLDQIELRRKKQLEHEEALLQSQLKYKELFETSMVGIYLSEIDSGKVLEGNNTVYKMFGVSKGQEFSFSNMYVDPQKRNEIEKIVSENGVVEKFEVRLRCLNDKVIWASISGKNLGNNKFQGVIQDITQSKENFLNLKKANFELDNFVYHASHDLRSPLLSVLGLVNISKKEEDLDQIRIALSLMEKSINKLDMLISDLLILSRDNRVSDAFQIIDIEKELKDCVENYGFLNSMHNISVSYNIKVEVPFVSDQTRFRVVMNNLVSNAIKYQKANNTEGFIKINVLSNDKECVFSIQDNGEGIPLENQSKIFDMFYRASEQSQGSGLGLYIVNNALDKLKGTIHFTSVAGEGTTFTVHMPNKRNLESKMDSFA